MEASVQTSELLVYAGRVVDYSNDDLHASRSASVAQVAFHAFASHLVCLVQAGS